MFTFHLIRCEPYVEDLLCCRFYWKIHVYVKPYACANSRYQAFPPQESGLWPGLSSNLLRALLQTHNYTIHVVVCIIYVSKSNSGSKRINKYNLCRCSWTIPPSSNSTTVSWTKISSASSQSTVRWVWPVGVASMVFMYMCVY